MFPGWGPEGTAYVCLDMLKPDSGRWKGWSSAYTLRVVLEQLGGFLLEDETIEQDYGGRVQRREREEWSSSLSSSSSTFSRASSSKPRRPSPPPSLPSPPLLPKVDIKGLCDLDEPLLYIILEGLDHVSLNRCIQAGSGARPVQGDGEEKQEEEGDGERLARVARDVVQRKQLRCFFTKESFKERCLGLGLKLSYAPRDRALKQALARPDLLSLHAFRSLGVKKDASNFAIDAILPVYLNPEHGPRALAELVTSVNSILPPGSSGANSGSVGSRLLWVMACIINSLVVEMAGGEEREEK